MRTYPLLHQKVTTTWAFLINTQMRFSQIGLFSTCQNEPQTRAGSNIVKNFVDRSDEKVKRRIHPTPDLTKRPPCRFVLGAAKHCCGEQKRPAGTIVSRSPNSFVFNDVVGVDLFFLNTYEKAHPTCHEHRVLDCSVWFPSETSRERLRGPQNETRGCDPTASPASFFVDQQCSICAGICAEKIESDGTRLEITPLKEPWRHGKTERARKNGKE